MRDLIFLCVLVVAAAFVVAGIWLVAGLGWALIAAGPLLAGVAWVGLTTDEAVS